MEGQDLTEVASVCTGGVTQSCQGSEGVSDADLVLNVSCSVTENLGF